MSVTRPGDTTDVHMAPSAPQRRTRGHVPGEVGIWVFIFCDMVVFGWFFLVFMHQRAQKPVAYNEAHYNLSLVFGGVNTVLLLTGSWFVVLAVNYLSSGRRLLGKRLILATIACGAAFVGNKALEYHAEIVAGHPADQADFFMFYFVLTAIHLMHLLLGILVLVIMWRVANKPELKPKNFRTLEAGASYWHLVDLLWLVLFALFYLVSN